MENKELPQNYIDGKTALSLAEERNYSEIIDSLKKYLPKRRLEL